MLKVGIIGATGYAGIELLRLLHLHPEATVTMAVTDSYADQSLDDIYPHLTPHVLLTGQQLDIERVIEQCELVFIALPDGHAKKIIPALLYAGIKVIDVGSDYRDSATYGLPEYPGARKDIAVANLIANPGCYPTASILATLPALQAGLIEENDCIYDAKSGVSGAGRKLSIQNHYCEMADNLIPYGVAGTHKHTPEIERTLSKFAQQDISIQFTPHVIPIIRGLSVTAYFKLKQAFTANEVFDIYEQFYQHERLIRMRRQIPQIKHVRGSLYCDISTHVDPKTNRLIVFSVIDNLMKGAAGQAIQNMNIMCRFPEAMGLDNGPGLYP